MLKVEVEEWFRGKERILKKLLVNGEDLVGEFIEQLHQHNKPDFARAMKLLEQLAEGQFSNRQRCKPLKGADKIYELRDYSGLRIYFFYHGTDVVFLCAGNLKGDGKQSALIKKSSDMRKAFISETKKN